MDIELWIAVIILFYLVLTTKSEVRKLQSQLDSEIVKRILGKSAEEENKVARTKAEINPEIPAEAPQVQAVKTEVEVEAAQVEAPKPIRSKSPDFITWIAGFAAVMGFFYFVRYSIENGLLTPAARMIMTTIAGFALIIAGVFFYSRRQNGSNRLIGEVLTGVGVSALYFAAFALSKVYSLAPDYVSMLLMCVITALAIGLTMRCGGQSTAFLALLGGFLTPTLSVGEPDIIQFCAYLFIVSSALMLMSRQVGSALLSGLTLLGLYTWVGFYSSFYFQEQYALYFFILLALSAAMTIVSADKFDNFTQNALGIISVVVCVLFNYKFLIRSGFGLQEWYIWAIIIIGLNVLTMWRPKAYLVPWAIAEIMVCILLFGRGFPPAEDTAYIVAMMSAACCLPMYIAVWIKPNKIFVMCCAIAVPVFYILTYAILNSNEIVPYVGMAAAALLAAPLIRLNFNDSEMRHSAGVLMMSTAAVLLLSVCSLIKTDLWAPVIALETLILGSIYARYRIYNLKIGMIAGLLFFAVCELKIFSKSLMLLLLAPLYKTNFYASDLTLPFYISEIIIPVLSFAGSAYLIRCEKTAKMFIITAMAFAFYGLFAASLQLEMFISSEKMMLIGYKNCIPITIGLLLFGLTFWKNIKVSSIAKVLFFIGVWRLVALDILQTSPFTNPINPNFVTITIMYGFPMALFFISAVNGNSQVRANFSLAAAAMSFIYITAAVTYAFYGTLYLEKIDFTDTSIFAYSAIWLVLACVWLCFAFKNKILVKPAFGLIYFVIAKVFLYDVSSLDGIWRISALFGLAGCLFAVSYFYGRYFESQKKA